MKIATGFPSAARAAKTLGVPKKVAKKLTALAVRSMNTGEFVLPGVGRLVRVKKGTAALPAGRPAFRVVRTP